MAFIMQTLVSFMFMKIHIVKKPKETPFSFFSLKLFVDCQPISLKRLSNGFIYKQKAHITKILYYALGFIVTISKIARRDLQNIGAPIFGII